MLKPSKQTPLQPILTWMSSKREEMAECLSDWISIRTENPPGNDYHHFVERLVSDLQRFGFRDTSVAAKANKTLSEGSSVVLCSYGRGREHLYFHGHYDVVPASSPDQFVPRREGENLFGRGSSDMKGGLVAMIYAMRALSEIGCDFDGRVTFCCVPDEETGGQCGSRAFEDSLGSGGVGMLTAEPTGGVVWNASRGAISLKITVEGKAAHVGLQHKGINAFEGMLLVAEELQQLKGEVERRRTSYRTKPTQAGHSILLLGGRCEGGSNFNVVPDRCWFTVDRRINPEEDLKTEKDRLFAALDRARARGAKLSVQILQEGNPAATEGNTALASSLREAVCDVRGKVPSFELCPGLLETRFYVAKGIPAYAYGPGLLSVSHGPNEFIPLANIEDCAAIYALTALRFFSPRR